MSTFAISENIVSSLQFLNYSPEMALKEFLVLNLSKNLSEFKNEDKYFEKKYSTIFAKFEEIINTRKDSENFEEYDDYMAWKFAIEHISIIKDKLNLIS